ncbi:metallophosphoesterase MPPED2-like isoform X2 [Mercenaria mercenaria]|nr:metallophosphoesterase MPPED2-like isoform X2 [Mercenaria mercenaria]
MRKTKSLTNELSAERTLTSLTNELSAGQKLTFVCISDTHCKLNKDDIGRIPHGDVLLHTGDFTMDGTERELIEFNNFLGALSHTYKVVIAGNHEFCLEDDGSWDRRYMRQHYREKYGVENIRDLLTNCIYLEDELTEICGIKIYGSPWTPMYSCCDAFSLSDREALQQKWDKIPTNVDILMTHGPPRGFGDTTTKGASAGCSNLLKTVQNRVKPKYHVFGHIHEGYGIYKDGKTTFINASICTRGYKPTNRPVKFRLYVPNSSVCDIDTANCSTKMGCESSRKGCDNSGCDTLEFVKCDNGCDTLEFVKHNNGCDTSEFVKPDNGCDTSEFVKCDNGCDSELTKTNARSFPGNTKPEQFKEKLRDCASNWNWAENDGTELNYTKLTYCEMHTGI